MLLSVGAAGCRHDVQRSAARGPSKPKPAARPASGTPQGAGAHPHHEPAAQRSVGTWLARHAAGATASEQAPAAALHEVVVYGAGPHAAADGSGVVRVVLRFDRVAVFDQGELLSDGHRPSRLYLDFQRTRFARHMRPETDVKAGGLEHIRLTEHGEDGIRVAFDLRPGTTHRLFFLTDPYRVVIDFDRATERASGVGGAAKHPVRTILLDPGHGGDDSGAEFDGLKESTLALDITRRAARLLRNRLPHTKVLMTRDGDDFVSLEQRAAMANTADADLFVSVHLNSSDSPVDKGGVATFVLDENNDQQALRLAARENGTSVEEVTGLQKILAGLYRHDQVEASRALAQDVQSALLTRARQLLPALPDRGVREAMFYVLVGARMPAILVEASFLTDPAEAKMLAKDRYRQALADGIAEGIQQYAETRKK